MTLGYAAFQGCYSLQAAEMPGCVEFGVRAFSECCALESVGNIVDGGSHLEEIPCRDVHLARCLQFAMHKFSLSLFVKDLEPGGTTFCFLIV